MILFILPDQKLLVNNRSFSRVLQLTSTIVLIIRLPLPTNAGPVQGA